MKVVILCSSLLPCGPENVLFNMVEAGIKSNIDIEFVIAYLSDTEDSLVENFHSLDVKTIGFHLKRFQVLFNLNKIRKVIKEENPDIIHACGYRPEIVLSLMNLPYIPKVTSVFNFPYEDYTMKYGKLIGLAMTYTSNFVYKKKFDMAIPCSQFIVNKYKERLGRIPFNYKVIHTGVPESFYVALTPENKTKKKKELGIPLDKKIFLFCALLINRKNPETVIQAFNELSDDLLLLVMGDGPLKGKCIDICNNPEKVRYLGMQPNTLEYMQVSDYLVSSSYSEGFPTAVLEAMSVGLTPILSAIGPHMEMLEGVDNPLIFNPNDKDKLKDIVRNVTNKESKDYRKYFVDYFSSRVMFNGHYQLYREIIKD